MKRIMIFGRPGSGKSTLAAWLAGALDLPLYHLDKYFYTEHWIERERQEFLKIQQEIVDRDCWIVDGNATRSLEMRWSKANLVLYFNVPRIICYGRIVKRFLSPNRSLDDRAAACPEIIRWSLVSYMWNFEDRVAQPIATLKQRYPQAVFKEIRSNLELNEYKKKLRILR